MAYLPLINVVPQFFDNLGDPLVGGTLNAYIAGTSTPTNMYSDISGTVAGSSVTLDSRGEPTTIKLIWLDTSISYKLILKDVNGITIWTEDDISVTGVADGSITSAKLANEAVTAAKIATSAVTTTKIANNAVTVGKLQNSGYELGMRNRIINGAMYISQRATTFTSAGAYTLDRWHYLSSGGAVATVTQNSDVPTGSEFQKSLRVAITTADTSIAAGDYSIVKQPIEASNVYDLISRTFTLSFWVRSTKTGTHCVSFRNYALNRSYIAEYSINASNTWEFKTITVTNGLTSAGSWTWGSADALLVGWTLATGSTYQSVANSWQVGNYIATANQVNCLDSTSNIFAITGVQLEAGATNTPFEYRSYDQELAMCQRYFEIAGSSSLQATTNLVETWSRGFAVRKRTNPTYSATPNQGTGVTYFGEDNGFYQVAPNTLNASVLLRLDAEFNITGA